MYKDILKKFLEDVDLLEKGRRNSDMVDLCIACYAKANGDGDKCYNYVNEFMEDGGDRGGNRIALSGFHQMKEDLKYEMNIRNIKHYLKKWGKSEAHIYTYLTRNLSGYD